MEKYKKEKKPKNRGASSVIYTACLLHKSYENLDSYKGYV